MNSAIILAGGVGKRFNNKTPKQFLKIDNKKLMIEYSIDKFTENENIDDIMEYKESSQYITDSLKKTENPRIISP